MFLSTLGNALSRRKATPYDLSDFLFSPGELQRKYEEGRQPSEHPYFSRTRWLRAVNAGASQDGYWQWVFEQVQAGDETFLLRH